MTEYTAHVQVPDAAIGAVLHDLLLGAGVSCATLRSGSGTWLSFGYHEETDDEATMRASEIRYRTSRTEMNLVPQGYAPESLLSFENAPMIITCGRTVIHSEGI